MGLIILFIPASNTRACSRAGVVKYLLSEWINAVWVDVGSL